MSNHNLPNTFNHSNATSELSIYIYVYILYIYILLLLLISECLLFSPVTDLKSLPVAGSPGFELHDLGIISFLICKIGLKMEVSRGMVMRVKITYEKHLT